MTLAKKILLFFFVISIFVASFLGYAFLTVIRPLMGLEIQPQGVEPISLSPVVLDVVVSIVNPGGATELPGANINLYLNDAYVGSGAIDRIRLDAGESRSLNVRISLDKSLPEVMLMVQGPAKLKIDGKLETRFIPIPIPKIPIPVPMDLNQFISSQESPIAAMSTIMEVMEDNPEITIEEALENEDIIKKIEEEKGVELTEEEIEELKGSIPLELQGKSLEEILNDPELAEKYPQK